MWCVGRDVAAEVGGVPRAGHRVCLRPQDVGGGADDGNKVHAAGIERIPNQKMLFNFITIGYTDNPGKPEETFFENIRKLPPATTLKYKTADNELVLEKYWDIDPEEQNKRISDQEAIEQFNHLFSTSVKRRLRSDVPIGTSLSGGLDSSSVLAFINELETINYSQNPADKQ